MDREEAKLLLQACRPNGADDASPVFAEALALTERDPELKTWWKTQREFDLKVAGKLSGVAVPDSLRATILAGRKIERMTPRFHLPYWLAAAAVIMLCAGLGFHYWPSSATQAPAGALASHPFPPPPQIGHHDYETGVFAFLQSDDSTLGMMSPDHSRVASWLKQQHSPTGMIPSKMETLPSVGCQTFAVHGHVVSLICFTLEGGGVAHLFTIENKALADPPGHAPQFMKMGTWAMASWSDSGHTYLLATQAGPDMLRHLL